MATWVVCVKWLKSFKKLRIRKTLKKADSNIKNILDFQLIG